MDDHLAPVNLVDLYSSGEAIAIMGDDDEAVVQVGIATDPEEVLRLCRRAATKAPFSCPWWSSADISVSFRPIPLYLQTPSHDFNCLSSDL